MTAAIDALIDRAIAAGREAYRTSYEEHGDRGMAGSSYSSVKDDEQHRPLIEVLRRRGIGSSVPKEGIWPDRWSVGARPFANPELVQNQTPQDAGTDAFAAVLREAGFKPFHEGYVD